MKLNYVSPAKTKRKMYWRELVHPQVQKRYTLIMRDGVSAVGNNHDHTNEDVRSIQWQKSLLDKIPDSTFEDHRTHYMNKIDTLQHQNKNLKQELFYLREAVLQSYNKKA